MHDIPANRALINDIKTLTREVYNLRKGNPGVNDDTAAESALHGVDSVLRLAKFFVETGKEEE